MPMAGERPGERHVVHRVQMAGLGRSARTSDERTRLMNESLLGTEHPPRSPSPLLTPWLTLSSDGLSRQIE